ncbi:hypothetical protein CC78DRAFT_92100 [Lojkania enalia]|uniref:Secreted protein n=1 Tax=Lojkania enalia TaxID=147567 RepID=A0A9P4KEJ0_9PLEO|nr:hypothetical protein CC78DRAFT_92100 [Didymosphaeria enalia]
MYGGYQAWLLYISRATAAALLQISSRCEPPSSFGDVTGGDGGDAAMSSRKPSAYFVPDSEQGTPANGIPHVGEAGGSRGTGSAEAEAVILECRRSSILPWLFADSRRTAVIRRPPQVPFGAPAVGCGRCMYVLSAVECDY